LDLTANQFRKIKQYEEIKGNLQVVAVLANLAVRTDRRKKGYAKKLLKSCEITAEVGH
jgi:N-acetylglutamate synthase-like GNAT family acetyltransferase